MLLVLVLASFFHVQVVVLAVVVIIIAMPLQQHFSAIRLVGLFTLLLVPAVLGLVVGYRNENYNILKDLYYFSLPVLFILCGIVLACRVEIDEFIRTMVLAGIITSVMVAAVSIYFVGLSALIDPYSAHYAIGIVGTPAPPLALALLLLSRKFNITLYSRNWFNIFTAVNLFGVYMFASRTYLVITCCFVFLLLADKLKKLWIAPALFLCFFLFSIIPADAFKVDSSSTFMAKIISSFSEISINEYKTEQDINIRYRGYESFMALRGYLSGTTPEWIFGGLGKLIDLKVFIRLGKDTEFQYIPVLHNGWLYILVKTGLTGVLVYLLVFFGLIITNWKNYISAGSKPIIRFFSAISIGCILSLLFTNYVVSAFFSVEMSIIMITLGYSYLNFRSLVYKVKQQEAHHTQAVPV
ncbi:hypothetical protein [Mucilaginibacter phyllosphaerae]|uniref:O-antigen ligase domain-containing protein n=1 Tax=Mucilaginibacter phyllosphaerae TaxID=1812349 RepID=A0A4Y8A7Z7_9SPHI|nr:hypothetical protein [Mucilaginibacter phyllosphaerae]MBB3970515.1 hypothetical protein [Mucilaginibacter phyllosphaerae]TEW64530.1 hypothetical protein E2R65_16030 [Mucilaginibacter phyllosphaerae]GGH19256.1 hypothetical protein GCM10007352_30510 [Mucilaginibacter phyllosphaerae]